MANNIPSPDHSPAFLRRRKFLLALPLLAAPFLALVFYSLGGGRDPGKKSVTSHSLMGFDTELPRAKFDRRDEALNKMGYYQKADADSLRKKELGQRDPYSQHPSLQRGEVPRTAANTSSGKADTLLRELEHLQKTIQGPPSPHEPPTLARLPAFFRPTAPSDSLGPVPQPPKDPQLEKLNTMLDKILRIQHPAEPPPGSAIQAGAPASGDSLSSATIPAVVEENQTLVTGMTMAFRLTANGLIGGRMVQKGQLLYGVVSLSEDRMQINITSIRTGMDIYVANLQVYDMDGLSGIHIPGLLSREVAKQSAGEGVNSVNVMSLDPSLGVQAANAGVQTAKSFLGKKVRLERVSVRAGYVVLIRNIRGTHHLEAPNSVPVAYIQPPGFVPGGSFLHRAHAEGIELVCRGIFLIDSLLWISVSVKNHSAIEYRPDYIRWLIRDRRQFKRNAFQDLAVEPAYSPELKIISRNSTENWWIGFQQFALAADKELIVRMGEKAGGRVLFVKINPGDLLNAKNSLK